MNNSTSGVFDKSLQLGYPFLNLSTFIYLIDEIILHQQQLKGNSQSIDPLLVKLGKSIGPKILDLFNQREKFLKRENKHLEMLKIVSTQVWKFLFGQQASHMEQTRDCNNEFIIKDYQFPLVKYISDIQSYSPAAFFQGLLEQFLKAAGFQCKVQYYVETQEDHRVLTAFIIEFDQEVIDREIQN